MLTTNLVKNLNGTSKIGDTVAAYFTAQVSDTQTSISMTISDSATYDANKSAVRADYAEFTALAYDLEGD